MKQSSNGTSGFIATYTVLVVMAVVIAVGISISRLAIGEAQGSLALTNGENTLAFVEGCAEDAMIKIRSSSIFNSATFTRPEGTCSITYNTGGPVNWDLTVTTTATTYVRRVRVVFTRTSSAIILSATSGWQEN